MTSKDIDQPEGWLKTSDTLADLQAFMYELSEARRVLVGLAFPESEGAEIQLRVSSIDEDAVVRRHDFVVDTYDNTQVAIEDGESFMRYLAAALPDRLGSQTQLSRVIENCITEFNSTPDSWLSFFS